MDTSVHYRQGDVLIVRCDTFELSASARPLPREEGRVVLAHGELTGHAHAISESDVEFYEQDGNTYIRVPREAVVQHEEHQPIPLSSGTYHVIRQREYVPGLRPSPAEIRLLRERAADIPMPQSWFRYVLD